MIVDEFNTDKGLYLFKLSGDFETTFHSHPTAEIISAEQGTFTLWIENRVWPHLKFAVIATNRKHKLRFHNGELKVTMVEHYHRFLKDQLALTGIDLAEGFYTSTEPENDRAGIRRLIRTVQDGTLATEYDDRIQAAITYLNTHDLPYHSLVRTLQQVTHLSESRLSHLFKANLGVSLKKYLIWTKLKSTVRQHLHTQGDLFSSLIDSGFYDQPHFSRNFKAMLGVQPSKAYNSRIVQVLPVRPQ